MKNSLIIIIIVALVAAGISFFAGTKYQQSKTPLFSGRMPSGQLAGRINNRGGFRPVSGEIISIDDKSLTVKLADGSSKIIILSEKTEVNEAQKKSQGDLKTGLKVGVFGIENSDGSVTAQNIQLNPVQFNVTPTPGN